MYLRLFTLSFCLCLFACQPIEEIIEEQEENGTFTAKIDGENFSVSGILVSAEYNKINEMVQTFSIAGAKPSINGVGTGIVLAIVSSDSTDIEAGEVYTATTATQIAGGEYVYEDGASIDVKAFSENTDVATVSITKLDLANKLISGTFSFDAVDEDDPTKTYKITDGVFTDIPFR